MRCSLFVVCCCFVMPYLRDVRGSLFGVCWLVDCYLWFVVVRCLLFVVRFPSLFFVRRV